MYADDTTYCCLEDITCRNKSHIINIELEGVHSWLKANRLALNVNKTKYICCLVSAIIITPAK